MTKKIVLTLIFITLFLQGIAQINTAKLDSFVNTVAKNNKGMGSLIISQNGQPVYKKAFGITTLPATAATLKTRYRIGSITKMFTAVMALQLIEENKLSLATPLSKFYPNLPSAKDINIGMLLNHRSGLSNFTKDPAYSNYMSTPHTEAEMLKIITSLKPAFKPDSTAGYSNTNYLLLGYIIEKIDGISYADALKRRIVSKAKLKDTYVGKKISVLNNEAYSFAYNGGWQLQPETDMSIPGGAGAIVSTPANLVLFIEALFSKKFISDKYLQYMMTIKDGYGMGMTRVDFLGNSSYGHSGSIDGFTSVLGYFPAEKMAFAYCSNGIRKDYTENNVVGGVLKIYFDKPFVIPRF